MSTVIFGIVALFLSRTNSKIEHEVEVRKRADELLREVNLQLEELNRTLETRVQERTRELEESQEQLVRREHLAAMGQLAGGVAHDLRNPLGAIKNAVYYLKRRLLGSEVAQANPRIGQFLQIVDQEVEHSSQIISDLLAFARVSTPDRTPTNLEQVIENSLSSLDIKDSITVVRELDPHLPEVMADSDQLYRVFSNLTGNAQDAMPNGGQITISARRGDGTAEVAFTDTGVGMDDETLEKIFEPLFTTKTRGTGLGLAICQQIVSRHGGAIAVVSTLGEGSTFTITIPLNGEASKEGQYGRDRSQDHDC